MVYFYCATACVYTRLRGAILLGRVQNRYVYSSVSLEYFRVFFIVNRELFLLVRNYISVTSQRRSPLRARQFFYGFPRTVFAVANLSYHSTDEDLSAGIPGMGPPYSARCPGLFAFARPEF